MDNDDDDIPVVTDSGSSGEQKESSAAQELVPSGPFRRNFPDTSEGLASNSRYFGGEVGGQLMAAWAAQIDRENQNLRSEKGVLEEKLEQKMGLLAQSRTDTAVLRARIRTDVRSKHLRNLAIAIGVSLFGVGVARAALDVATVGFVVSGVLLIIAGWFTGPGSDPDGSGGES